MTPEARTIKITNGHAPFYGKNEENKQNFR